MDSKIVPPQRLSPEDEKKLSGKIKSRFDESARWDQPWKDQNLVSFKYLNDSLPEDWPYFSKVFESETRRVTDETVETIMAEVFGRDVGFLLKPRGGQDDLARTKLQQLMRYIFNLMGHKALKFQQFQECVAYGHGIQFHFTKPYFRRKMVRQQVPGPIPGMLGFKNGIEDSVEFWPAGKIVSRFDFYPAPLGHSIDSMPYCFVVERRLLDGVKWQGKQNGWNHVDELKGAALYAAREGVAWTSDTVVSYSLAERLASIGIDSREGWGQQSNGDRYAELLWYFEANPWGSGLGRLTLLSEWKILQDWAGCPWLHGEKPLSEIFFARKQDPDLWQADGLPWIIRQYQEKLNERSSLISDVIAETAFPMLLVDKSKLDGKVNMDWFDFAPGRKIPVVGDPKSVAAPAFTARIPQELWDEMDLSRASIQRLSKVFDATRNIGGASSGVGEAAKTARGLGMIIQQAQSSVTFKLLYAEETGIKKGLELDLANTQEALTDEQVISVTDPPPMLSSLLVNGGMPIGPGDVAGDWHIEPVGASESANSDEKVQKLQAWLQAWAQQPQIAGVINWLEAARISGRMLDIPELDKILPQDSAQKVAEMMQKQQQLKELQQHLSTAGADAEVMARRAKALKDASDAHVSIGDNQPGDKNLIENGGVTA